MPEHNGWKAMYEQGEEYWEEQERLREAAIQAERDREERHRQADFRRLVEDVTACLQLAGLLREDRLSYTRICHLEWETGIRTGSWSERWTELGEAQLKDKETHVR